MNLLGERDTSCRYFLWILLVGSSQIPFVDTSRKYLIDTVCETLSVEIAVTNGRLTCGKATLSGFVELHRNSLSNILSNSLSKSLSCQSERL